LQAAMKVVHSYLNGTIRLIVSPGSPRRCGAPTGMLFCAYPVMTIRVMGAFKMHLRQYCGPERTPPRDTPAQLRLATDLWLRTLPPYCEVVSAKGILHATEGIQDKQIGKRLKLTHKVVAVFPLRSR
jgi:hypothetical protein